MDVLTEEEKAAVKLYADKYIQGLMPLVTAQTEMANAIYPFNLQSLKAAEALFRSLIKGTNLS